MENMSWNELKSQRLKKIRGVSFEELVSQRLVATEDHPRISTQRLMLYEYKGHIWVVPYVLDGAGVFLKTLYPSRKHTKKYLGRDL